jgi:hypothetical protein
MKILAKFPLREPFCEPALTIPDSPPPRSSSHHLTGQQRKFFDKSAI